MRILVTNDDGIDAPGIIALIKALDQWVSDQGPGAGHELIVLAPDANYSGAAASVGDVFASDGIDFERRAVPGAEHVEAFALDAPPALCVIVGCRGAFGARPDLIVSGINAGVNVGYSVLHSGTIGAALTGSQMGISGLAISLQARKGADYSIPATLALGLVEELENAPAGTMLSLNVPALPFEELKGVRRGRVASAGLIKEAHRGTPHAHAAMKVGEKAKLDLNFGAASPELGDVSDEVSNVDDGALIAQGYVSITQLHTIHDIADPEAEAPVHSGLSAVERMLRALQEHS